MKIQTRVTMVHHVEVEVANESEIENAILLTMCGNDVFESADWQHAKYEIGDNPTQYIFND